jgi:hypothetical protein
MKRSRFSEEQIIGILKEHETGVPVSYRQILVTVRAGQAAAIALLPSSLGTHPAGNPRHPDGIRWPTERTMHYRIPSVLVPDRLLAGLVQGFDRVCSLAR